jgi:hypothetical protein
LKEIDDIITAFSLSIAVQAAERKKKAGENPRDKEHHADAAQLESAFINGLQLLGIFLNDVHSIAEWHRISQRGHGAGWAGGGGAAGAGYSGGASGGGGGGAKPPSGLD